MSEEITVRLNVEEAEQQMATVEADADSVAKEAKRKLGEAQHKSDQTWIKAVAIVQKVESVLFQALSFAGITVDAITTSVISTVNQAIAVIYPLLQAEVLSGFATASAVLGLISLGFSIANVGKLVAENEKIQSDLTRLSFGMYRSNNGVY